jgi:hypothetical protein
VPAGLVAQVNSVQLGPALSCLPPVRLERSCHRGRACSTARMIVIFVLQDQLAMVASSRQLSVHPASLHLGLAMTIANLAQKVLISSIRMRRSAAHVSPRPSAPLARALHSHAPPARIPTPQGCSALLIALSALKAAPVAPDRWCQRHALLGATPDNLAKQGASHARLERTSGTSTAHTVTFVSQVHFVTAVQQYRAHVQAVRMVTLQACRLKSSANQLKPNSGRLRVVRSPCHARHLASTVQEEQMIM